MNEQMTKAEMAARLAAIETLADDWLEWARFRSTTRIDAFRHAAEQILAIIHDDDAECCSLDGPKCEEHRP